MPPPLKTTNFPGKPFFSRPRHGESSPSPCRQLCSPTCHRQAMPGIATTETSGSNMDNKGGKKKFKNQKRKERKQALQSNVGGSSSGRISPTAGNFLRSCWRGRRAAKPAGGRHGLPPSCTAQSRARRRVPGQRRALTARGTASPPRPERRGERPQTGAPSPARPGKSTGGKTSYFHQNNPG